MPKYSIELKRSYSDSPPLMGHDDHPTVTIDLPKKMALPESGEITFMFKVLNREENVQTGKYCERLALMSIEGVESDEPSAPATNGTEAGEALDKLRKAQKEYKEEED